MKTNELQHMLNGVQKQISRGSFGLDVNIIWGIAIRPLLFGSIGAAFELSVMAKESVLKRCAV